MCNVRFDQQGTIRAEDCVRRWPPGGAGIDDFLALLANSEYEAKMQTDEVRLLDLDSLVFFSDDTEVFTA